MQWQIQGHLGCARFAEIVWSAKFLWSLCSVDFHSLTLQFPMQTPHSVAPELQAFVSSLENCQHFSKTDIHLDSVKFFHFHAVIGLRTLFEVSSGNSNRLLMKTKVINFILQFESSRSVRK